MVKYLLEPGKAETVIGLASMRAGLEWMFGPLERAAVRLAHLRLLHRARVPHADLRRPAGRPRARPAPHRHPGRALMALGHFMMAFESLFLLALLMLILGNGAFKPNISTQVGGLYAPGDSRRDRAYSIFYVGINIGAFFSPLVCRHARGALGLALRLRGRRGRHDDRAHHLSHRLSEPAARRDAQGTGRAARSHAALGRGTARRARPARAVPADLPVLGDLRAGGQHDRAVGRRLHRPYRQPAGLDRRDPGDLVPGIQSVHDLRIHAARHMLWGWQSRRGREPSTSRKWRSAASA